MSIFLVSLSLIQQVLVAWKVALHVNGSDWYPNGLGCNFNTLDAARLL